jgi:hypothetical protein
VPHRATHAPGWYTAAETPTHPQKASGYNWRALAEADVSRFKRVIGSALRSRTDGRQGTEVAIAVDVLNRMLDLGRPEYVRIA